MLAVAWQAQYLRAGGGKCHIHTFTVDHIVTSPTTCFNFASRVGHINYQIL